MSLPCNTHVTVHDPALPGLATLLDPEAFVALLTRIAPAHMAQDADISYIKYKPHTSCLVGYRLSGVGEAVDVYARAQRRVDFNATTGDAQLIDAEQALEVHFFPSDRRIVGLKALEDKRRSRLLQRLFPKHDARWRQGRLERLVYKPERRYVAQVQVGGAPHAALKFYTPTGYAAAAQAQQAANRATLRVAPTIGRHERRAVIAYEWLNGQLAHAALTDPAIDADVFAPVGVALAELHDQPPGTLPTRTPEHEIDAIHAAAAAVAVVCPPLAAQAERLAERLAQGLVRQPGASGMIHGDFYARQALLQGSTVALIDFDEAAYGERAGDLGNFLAHLEYDVLCGALQRARAEAVGAALLEGYHRTSNALAATSLTIYVAARLLLLTPHPFRKQEPDWPEHTAAILDRVAELVSQHDVACHRDHRAHKKATDVVAANS